jgi:hypothetical protein
VAVMAVRFDRGFGGTLSNQHFNIQGPALLPVAILTRVNDAGRSTA